MAARRLLIVLLVLLGISTLAAALVPPRSLRDSTSSQTTTTVPTQTLATPAAPPGAYFPVTIKVGGKRVPVVACSAANQRRRRCEPIRVGDRLALTVSSRRPAELWIPSFGLVDFAAPGAPASFDLLFEAAANYGIRFTDTGRVAARIQVLPARAKEPRRQAPGGSGPA